jgi:hypothetical protein
MRRARKAGWLALGAGALLPAPAPAQGTDQPPAQRDAQIIARWLPGAWDSIEQAYFEGRRNRPGGTEADARANPRAALAIVAEAEVLRVRRATGEELWRLEPAAEVTRLLTSRAGVCPVLLRREAGQFAGSAEPTCRGERRTLLITQRELWEGPGDDRAALTRFRRARSFTCYVDIPGVGGGRAIPFRRHGPFEVSDQGGEARFQTAETPPRELSIRLRSVAWPYNNAPTGFTRDSLTLYVAEMAGGERREIAYGWGEPGATRLGLNLKQLLVNCAVVPPDRAEPEF